MTKKISDELKRACICRAQFTRYLPFPTIPITQLTGTKGTLMRSMLAALTLPLLSLAACGGAGMEGASAGFAASPPSGGTLTPTPTPTPTSQANLFDVKSETTFDTVGALQSLETKATGEVLYRGNASTVSEPSGTITYNPRDGIFTVKLADTKAGVSKNITFQDPAHRTDADLARVGNYQVPLLPGFNYLQTLNDGKQFTFFYQRPSATGSFVSLAGFEQSDVDPGSKLFTAQQGVLVFGTPTATLQIPGKGAGTYTGVFLATMVGNQPNETAPVLQWINGTTSVNVNFSDRTVALALSGLVGPAYVKDLLVHNTNLVIGEGATFSANGSATWAKGGNAFSGQFSSASFTSGTTVTKVDFTSASAGTGVAGASSIDGTFYGPDAKNIGGNFRIVGGIPNQRLDILGGFVGK